MHKYLIDTKYAASNLIDLIMHDETELEQAEKRYHQVREELKLYEQRFYTADISDALSPMQLQYEYLLLMKQTEGLSKQEKVLISQIEYLKELIDAKSFAIKSLCGALLQIAKQGISIVYKGSRGCPASCPDGRSIGNDVLKNIIWQGRNQSMHYEEGDFKAGVEQCFQNLETSFGDEFSLRLHPSENFARKVVIKILSWNDYQVYKQDMISLIG